MKKEIKKLITEYLRFMISSKEIKGKGYRNRPASKFYEYLRRDADLYKCSVMDVLYRDAEYVLNGVFIDLMKLGKTERITQVIKI